MATHSSILAWKTPRTEEPEGLHSSWSHKESDVTEHTRTHIACSLKYTSWPISGNPASHTLVLS